MTVLVFELLAHRSGYAYNLDSTPEKFDRPKVLTTNKQSIFTFFDGTFKAIYDMVRLGKTRRSMLEPLQLL